MKYVKLVTLIFGICSIVLFNSCLWLVKTFGNITFEQMAWHLANLPSLAYVDTDYEIRAVKFIVFTLFLITSFILLTKYIDKIFLFIKHILTKTTANPSINKNISSKLNYALLVISIVFLAGSTLFVQKNIDFVSHINSADYGFIEANYHIPDKNQISFEKKKNLVIIFAESLENSFSHPALRESYLPNLTQWRDEKQYNTNMRQVSGTGWTVAALTGWAFGLPLKTPANIGGNAYTSKQGFLPHATSIFDILQQHGYELVVLIGTDKRFAGQGILFSGHGNFKIYDQSYFENAGWSLQEHRGVWGFSDKFIFERAFEEYQRLSSGTKPFVLFVQTIDMHIPNGYCPESKKKYNDIRDAIVYFDTNINTFLANIEREREREREPDINYYCRRPLSYGLS